MQKILTNHAFIVNTEKVQYVNLHEYIYIYIEEDRSNTQPLPVFRAFVGAPFTG